MCSRAVVLISSPAEPGYHNVSATVEQSHVVFLTGREVVSTVEPSASVGHVYIRIPPQVSDEQTVSLHGLLKPTLSLVLPNSPITYSLWLHIVLYV